MDPETHRPILYRTTDTQWDGKVFKSGLMRSMDCGQTWKEMNGGQDKNLPTYGFGQRQQFLSMTVPEKDARIVYVTVHRQPEEPRVKVY
jgi:hypothetical protein